MLGDIETRKREKRETRTDLKVVRETNLERGRGGTGVALRDVDLSHQEVCINKGRVLLEAVLRATHGGIDS